MATFTAIKNTTQSSGSMRGALNYIKRKDKTLWDGRQLVSGWNCVAQSAYDEMMTTKRRHGKPGDRMFYQFVQSFSPEETVTPEEVHAIGLELAQRLFPDFEVVVATHVDNHHLHSHLIVNSVSWKDGHKLHQNAADLQRQRLVNDEICAVHGLTVLTPPKARTQAKQMRPGEYRAAVKGQAGSSSSSTPLTCVCAELKPSRSLLPRWSGGGIKSAGREHERPSPTPLPSG